MTVFKVKSKSSDLDYGSLRELQQRRKISEDDINMENRISIKLRLGSMLLDHIIMCFVIIPPLIILSLISSDPFETSQVEIVAYFVMMLIYFNKDLLNGRSAAKRISGLWIIDRKTGQPADELKCFLRNVTIPLWPLEAFISVLNPSRRIGDFIANTRVETAGREDVTSIFEDLKRKKLTYLTLWTLVSGVIYMGVLWYFLEYLVKL